MLLWLPVGIVDAWIASNFTGVADLYMPIAYIYIIALPRHR